MNFYDNRDYLFNLKKKQYNFKNFDTYFTQTVLFILSVCSIVFSSIYAFKNNLFITDNLIFCLYFSFDCCLACALIVISIFNFIDLCHFISLCCFKKRLDEFYFFKSNYDSFMRFSCKFVDESRFLGLYHKILNTEKRLDNFIKKHRVKFSKKESKKCDSNTNK